MAKRMEALLEVEAMEEGMTEVQGEIQPEFEVAKSEMERLGAVEKDIGMLVVKMSVRERVERTLTRLEEGDPASLGKGARIVRIATHPSAMRLGYGSAAVELLTRYFEGQLTATSEMDVEYIVETPNVKVTEAAEKIVMEPHSFSVDERISTMQQSKLRMG